MTNICAVCGRTKSEAIADTNALGLQQEFQAGIYTCCQIGQWADEQALAWFEAVEEDNKGSDNRAVQPHTREPQPAHKICSTSNGHCEGRGSPSGPIGMIVRVHWR